EVLVGLLLPLLGHGLGGLAAEGADDGEEAEGGGEDEADVEEEALALTGGVESTGAVGAEGDPVGWEVGLALVIARDRKRRGISEAKHLACRSNSSQLTPQRSPANNCP